MSMHIPHTAERAPPGHCECSGHMAHALLIRKVENSSMVCRTNLLVKEKHIKHGESQPNSYCHFSK